MQFLSGAKLEKLDVRIKPPHEVGGKNNKKTTKSNNKEQVESFVLSDDKVTLNYLSKKLQDQHIILQCCCYVRLI